MSTINGGGEGDVADSQPKEKDLLYSIRNIKMLIDLVASHLETSRLQIPTDSDCPPNTLEENIIHLEVSQIAFHNAPVDTSVAVFLTP